MKKRKRRKTKLEKLLATPKKREKSAIDLSLVHTKALLVVKNYLDGKEDLQADHSMLRFLKEHKKHKEEVRNAIVGALRYLTKERFQPDPDDPKNFPAAKGDPPPENIVKSTKKRINVLAKKVWKPAKKTT